MDERSGEDTAAPEQEQVMSDHRKKAESHIPAGCRGKGSAQNTATSLTIVRLAPKMGKLKGKKGK